MRFDQKKLNLLKQRVLETTPMSEEETKAVRFVFECADTVLRMGSMKLEDLTDYLVDSDSNDEWVEFTYSLYSAVRRFEQQ